MRCGTVRCAGGINSIEILYHFSVLFYKLFLTLIYLIFFWLSSFLFPEIINRENKLSQKNKKTKFNRSKVLFDVLTKNLGKHAFSGKMFFFSFTSFACNLKKVTQPRSHVQFRSVFF
jgi:hypothetical protein